jgi:hypothetical protein
VWETVGLWLNQCEQEAVTDLNSGLHPHTYCFKMNLILNNDLDTGRVKTSLLSRLSDRSFPYISYLSQTEVISVQFISFSLTYNPNNTHLRCNYEPFKVKYLIYVPPSLRERSTFCLHRSFLCFVLSRKRKVFSLSIQH